MRGEVLFYDEARGSGFITGDDGNRYTFLASDLRQRARIAKGLRIDFRTEDDRARDIFLATGDGAAPARAAQPQARSVPEMPATATATAPPPAAPPLATAGERPDTALGVAGYFARAVTSDFANFRGRARRKEYWSFVLVVFLAYVAMAAVGLPVDAILGNLDVEEPIVTGILAALVMLAAIVPGLAVTVRRLHDIGLSGWLVLLALLPYAGSLIMLVFALMPSKRQANRWGPVPAGA
jgi:uncharacterized membrane protein YhaH (DUF805 family)/cold shock CspA family protein